MITLITGLPGSGKTLYTLNMIVEYAKKEPHRKVFYSGIRDLIIPGWTNIGGYEKDPDTGVTAEVIPPGAPVKGGGEWFKLPHGSIVVIDECQNYFRPRGTGSAVPQMVKEFETHRHGGFDIFLITQHPMIIDNNVRRLVERHMHVKRWFGLAGANVHEFNGVKVDVDKNVNGSILHKFKYPKSSYAWYKSAEIHTVKARVPARVYLLFVIPPILFGLGYFVYRIMAPYVTSEGAKQRIEGIAPDPKGQRPVAAPGSNPDNRSAPPREAHKMTTVEYVEQFKPRVGGMPHTAPMFDEVLKPVSAPTPSACISEGERCNCYTEQATAIDIDAGICRQIVQRGYFQYWVKRPDIQGIQPQQPQRRVEPVPATVPGMVPASVSPGVVPPVSGPQSPGVAMVNQFNAPVDRPEGYVRPVVPADSVWRFKQ